MKNKFIKSTIILMFGGIVTKILGMFIKIVLTRTISLKGIGVYSLILPTFNLFITLCSLGMPVAISKMVSEQKRRGKKIVLSILPVLFLFNVFLIIILFIVSRYLSYYFLHNPDTYYPLICIGFTLPFICISSVLKGYFFGKERMGPVTFSNIVEQLVRLILTIVVVSRLMNYSFTYAICGVVLINIFSEGASILFLLLFLPKNKKITIQDFQCDRDTLKDLLHVSIPTTGSRLIGSLCYFLEPIILSFTLTCVGYTNEFIVMEYGIINGYVYALLLLPSFFTLAISSALLPVVSHSYSTKNYQYTYYKIKQAIFLSLLIGIPCTLLFMFVPHIFLKLIYNTNRGIIYIKMMAPIFLLYYVQGPLTTAMQGMNKAREAMMGTLYGSVIRTLLLFLLSLLHIGMWGLLIASCSNIIFITVHHIYYVFYYDKKKQTP